MSFLNFLIEKGYYDYSSPNTIQEKRSNKKSQHKLREDYQLYHDSYTSAVKTAKEIAASRGYVIDDDEVMQKIGLGPRKPSPGNTNTIHLNLYDKNGKQARERLHFQVYNRGTDKRPYELNVYIS